MVLGYLERVLDCYGGVCIFINYIAEKKCFNSVYMHHLFFKH